VTGPIFAPMPWRAGAAVAVEVEVEVEGAEVENQQPGPESESPTFTPIERPMVESVPPPARAATPVIYENPFALLPAALPLRPAAHPPPTQRMTQPQHPSAPTPAPAPTSPTFTPLSPPARYRSPSPAPPSGVQGSLFQNPDPWASDRRRQERTIARNSRNRTLHRERQAREELARRGRVEAQEEERRGEMRLVPVEIRFLVQEVEDDAPATRQEGGEEEERPRKRARTPGNAPAPTLPSLRHPLPAFPLLSRPRPGQSGGPVEDPSLRLPAIQASDIRNLPGIGTIPEHVDSLGLGPSLPSLRDVLGDVLAPAPAPGPGLVDPSTVHQGDSPPTLPPMRAIPDDTDGLRPTLPPIRAALADVLASAPAPHFKPFPPAETQGVRLPRITPFPFPHPGVPYEDWQQREQYGEGESRETLPGIWDVVGDPRVHEENWPVRLPPIEISDVRSLPLLRTVLGDVLAPAPAPAFAPAFVPGPINHPTGDGVDGEGEVRDRGGLPMVLGPRVADFGPGVGEFLQRRREVGAFVDMEGRFPERPWSSPPPPYSPPP